MPPKKHRKVSMEDDDDLEPTHSPSRKTVSKSSILGSRYLGRLMMLLYGLKALNPGLYS